MLADFAPGAALADMRQVHGTDGGDRSTGRRRPVPTPTALVTTSADVVLMVRAADCVPVLLADPEAGVIGAAHAGRPGLAAGVVPATVAGMRELGAARDHRLGRPARLRWLLRGAGGDAGRGRRASCRPRVATTSWGTPSLDLGAGVRAQLAREASPSSTSPAAPASRADLYSYRRDGAGAGRLAGLVWMTRMSAREPPRRDRRRPRRRTRAGSPTPAPTPAATPDEVTLVVVTKFFPASDVRLLADLGVTDVGENRHQEAEAKAAECADLGLRWHFIGGLQSNKAAAVAAYADVVESVDRAKLVAPPRPRARTSARTPLDVPAPGQPRPARRAPAASGADPAGPGRPGRRRSTRPGCSGCAA